ncbi:hypothetical protein JCM16408A_42200 [Methylobacterium phyllosphaerae]
MREGRLALPEKATMRATLGFTLDSTLTTKPSAAACPDPGLRKLWRMRGTRHEWF